MQERTADDTVNICSEVIICSTPTSLENSR